MRWTGIVIVAALGGCSPGRDTFIVSDPQSIALSATLHACGSEVTLDRQGSDFLARPTIRCEGGGLIRVTYRDDRTVDCPIDYLTPHGAQQWHFQLHAGACEEVFARQEGPSN